MAIKSGKGILANYFLSLGELYNERPYVFAGEAFVLFLLFYFTVFKRPYDPSKKGYGARPPAKIPANICEELIEEWEPRPLLHLDVPPILQLGKERVLSSPPGPLVTLDGKKGQLVNFCCFDFLGINGRQEQVDASIQSLNDFGCGSCGPRGFYGTSDEHLRLEKRLAHFLETDDAVLYSDAATTPASVISAFSKRGDVIVCDEGISESNLTGLELSRSKLFFFKHNDMEDCERQMIKADRYLKKKNKQLVKRKFLVVEGLYRNYGDIANLVELKRLKEKYYFRAIIDDSMGICALGATGRGSIEHCGLKLSDFEILCGSLATSMASIGGFCVGYVPDVIDHQRLSGAGYVFSASSPPFTCSAAVAAINIIDDKSVGKELLAKLQRNISSLRNAGKNIKGLKSVSSPESPIQHFHVDVDTENRLDAETKLQRIVDVAEDEGLLICRSRYVPVGKGSARPAWCPPSIRVTVTASHTEGQIKRGMEILENAVKKVL